MKTLFRVRFSPKLDGDRLVPRRVFYVRAEDVLEAFVIASSIETVLERPVARRNRTLGSTVIEALTNECEDG